MRRDIVIDRRFRGPPDSGNGGYVAGLFGRELGAAAEVTLRAPPPLERPMTLTGDEAKARLLDGDVVVAEGEALEDLDVAVPPPASYDDALEAARASFVLVHAERHPFPGCFVCGPARDADDGLRIFVGPLRGRGVAAAGWIPHASLADADGTVRPEFVWAALDCSGGIGSIYVDGEAEEDLPTYVLGRLAARLVAPVHAGTECVVTGWRLRADGRKLDAGSAVHDRDGTLLAYARATWIALRA
ncbi:MAG TPA: hypothetical protein VIB48_12685 [Acidimicrobiia bacterium]